MRNQIFDMMDDLRQMSKENFDMEPYSSAVDTASRLSRQLYECFADTAVVEVWNKYINDEEGL